MYCSRCGGPNTDDARFCAGCGQALATTAQDTAPPPAYAPAPPPPAQQQYFAGAAAQPAPQPQAPAYAGQPQQSPPQQPAYYQDPRSRSSAPVPMAPAGQVYAVGKSPGLAVFLSFLIPGVGQFYCGANTKGAIMLAIYLVSWFLAAFAIGFVGVVGVWIWAMIDAYNLASRKTPLS